MASSFVVDTHALLWYLEGNRQLGARAKSTLSAPESHLVVPIIVLAEADVIITHGRTRIPSIAYLIEKLVQDPRFEIFPLTLAIFRRSLSPEAARVPELHDRIIAATSLYLQDLGIDVALITRDESISNAQLVPVIW
jgi:PIN domain nuclease of toxin-antitoxin system